MQRPTFRLRQRLRKLAKDYRKGRERGAGKLESVPSDHIAEAAAEWDAIYEHVRWHYGSIARDACQQAWDHVQESLAPNRHEGGPALWARSGGIWTAYGWRFCVPSWSEGEEVRVFRLVHRRIGPLFGAYRIWIVAVRAKSARVQQIFVHAGRASAAQMDDAGHWEQLWHDLVLPRIEGMPTVISDIQPLVKV